MKSTIPISRLMQPTGIQVSMASPAIAAYPIRTLRELVATLEAAITAAVADPNPKAVHRLRTTTRRIEAQLELLALLPTLPPHAKPARKARKLLRKLRRAAGRVRDFDIHYHLTQTTSPSLAPEARRLRDLFKLQRGEEAERLLHTLDKHQPKLALILEGLLEALAPAEALALPVANVAQLTLHWYVRNCPATAKQDHHQLHDIRKVAKLARYIVELALPATKAPTPVRRLARAFESLQQSGGNWHDWATLSNIARRELGPSSPLTQFFSQRCEKSLLDYRRHLKSFSKSLPLFTDQYTEPS
ncbi:MAG: CHAD domain-containing protein [Edaphobacter sp.]